MAGRRERGRERERKRLRAGRQQELTYDAVS